MANVTTFGVARMPIVIIHSPKRNVFMGVRIDCILVSPTRFRMGSIAGGTGPTLTFCQPAQRMIANRERHDPRSLPMVTKASQEAEDRELQAARSARLL